MAYNPLYPALAKYEVSQEIFDLHAIEIWQYLIGILGKRRTFVYLAHRYQRVSGRLLDHEPFTHLLRNLSLSNTP